MKTNKSKPFEELMAAFFTYGGQKDLSSSTLDKEADLVFSEQFSASLSKEKSRQLLSSLESSLSKDTLGTLVQHTLSKVQVSISELQTTTGLPPSLIEEIKSDMVFTNSIPVKSLVKLLKLLNISLDKAQSAIQSTFEKLTAESKIFLSIPLNAQPAFRKSMSHSDSALDFKRFKSDESYLYQNKEALQKYTTRLAELYSEL